MNLLQKLNIKAKLVFIITATSAVSLLLAAGVIHTYSIYDYREEMVIGLVSDARLIAYNSTAAIEFDSPEEAEAGLGALQIHDNIVGACITTQSDTIFAAYLRDGVQDTLFEVRPLEQGHHFADDRIWVAEHILLDNTKIGTIFLVSDLTALTARVKRNLTVEGIILLCVALVSLILSLRIQRLISGPILGLAHTAKTISEKKDYSLRATQQTNDELGLLTGQFNNMLQQIQSQDEALREANEQLEERVKNRTEALQAAVEAAEAASCAKGDFLANMSHELRTPLNGIVGMMELLTNSDLTDKQQERVQLVVQSADSLATIVNDILDFSKIEAGKLELDPRPFKLDELVHGVSELLSVTAVEKGVHLFANVEADTPTHVIGDASRVRQILTNVVGNAVKFTECGRILVHTGHEPMDGNKALFTFTVEDTGIGIKKEQLDSIFDNFAQADASTTRNYGGTGLGLAITQKLVEMMGGSIRLDSEVSKGTKVYFSMVFTLTTNREVEGTDSQGAPQLHSEDDPATRNAIEDHAPALSPPIFATTTSHVLLVEDNAINQSVALGHLEQLGLEADVAENGRDAVEMVTGNNYDLVLMDVQMPVMDGYTATREIRKSEMNSRIPIVAMTANAMSGDRERCLSAGMDDYLAKPLHSTSLRETLAKYLGVNAMQGQQTAVFLLVVDGEEQRGRMTTMLSARWPNSTFRYASSAIEARVSIESEPPHCVLVHGVMREQIATGLHSFMKLEKRYENTRLILWADDKQTAATSTTMPTFGGPDDIDTLEAILTDTDCKAAPPENGFSEPDPSEVENTEDQSMPVFDRELALSYCAGSTERLDHLIKLVLGDLPVQLDGLSEAVAAGDFVTAERCYHTVKGQAAYLGAVRLREVALAGEAITRSGQAEAVERVIPDLRECITELCAVLENERSKS